MQSKQNLKLISMFPKKTWPNTKPRKNRKDKRISKKEKKANKKKTLIRKKRKSLHQFLRSEVTLTTLMKDES